MLSIKNTVKLTDEQYMDANEVEDFIVWPLSKATGEIYDSVTGLDGRKVDIPEQQEYIRSQIEEMIYQLKQIQDNLGG